MHIPYGLVTPKFKFLADLYTFRDIAKKGSIGKTYAKLKNDIPSKSECKLRKQISVKMCCNRDSAK